MEIFQSRRSAAQCRDMEALAVIDSQMPVRGIAQPHRLFEHRAKDWGKIAGRGIDNLQYLSGRGLLLQRLARLGQEPRILHRDNGLGSEVLQQRDLFLGECTDFPAIEGDRPEQGAMLPQCDSHQAARPAKFD